MRAEEVVRRLVASRPRWRPRRTGLVLSGGGARADFEIGALRYLYDRERIAPQVLAGTSAGSILAAVLAQSGDHAGQRRSLDALEALWRGMRHSSEMFTPHEWFVRLRRRGPEWLAVLQRRQQRPGPLDPAVVRERLRTMASSRTWPPSRPAAQREDHGETDGTIGVIELLTALREVGRARPDIELILRGADQEKAMYRPGPLVERLVDPEIFAAERVAAAGVTLRIAVVALESGELRYVTEDGRIVDRENRTVEEGPVDLVEGIRASCAIPAVFRPVPLGAETYVDGGVRETLPAELVTDHLGVDHCYAVVASPPGVPHEDSYRDKDMLSVVLRATAGIMADEGLRDEVERARRDGVSVIAPEIDLHDILTVDPGLTAIAMDYGFLRAAEVVQGASARERAISREAIALRRETWAYERELLTPWAEGEGEGTVASAPSLTELAARKRRLRALVAQIPPGRRPPGAVSWWRRFEGHRFGIAVEPDWV